MEDNKIIELYLQRQETAIEETAKKYQKYCHSIAYNILFDKNDADEVVNDTYLGAWNSIPPHKPTILSTFLGKITRRISIKKWGEKTAQKRGGGEIPLVLGELSECIPDLNSVEKELENKYLSELINKFLLTLPKTERKIFICRYWYLDSILSISNQFGFSESKIKSMLYRTRKKMKIFLEKEGVFDEI